MSASMIKDHGSSKMSGMFVTDTKVGKSRQVAEKHLPSLIAKTTGIARERPVMEGVLSSTKQGIKDKDVPEVHKIHKVGKTQAKKMGMTPYAGPKY